MEGGERHDPGYDDWFDEPEPPTQEAGRGARAAYDEEIADDDVWVLPGDEPRRPRSRPGGREVVLGGHAFTPTQVAIVLACAVALLIGGLAAGGVFSGGKEAVTISTPTAPPTTAPTTTAPPTTTTAVTAPTIALSPGDTGSQVKLLQTALNALGYSVGKPDGDYGPATEDAVKQFQTAKGLTADGVVGPQTLTAIQQELSG